MKVSSISTHPGYYVTTQGRVYSTKSGTVKELKRFKGDGRYWVSLSTQGAVINKRVSHLVAAAFIPNPQDLPQINHKDGNKLNDAALNLEWVTAQGNTCHAFKLGLRNNKGSKNPNYRTR